MSLKNGSKLKNDRYEVLNEIGSGGFGIVYLVFDNELKKK